MKKILFLMFILYFNLQIISGLKKLKNKQDQNKAIKPEPKVEMYLYKLVKNKEKDTSSKRTLYELYISYEFLIFMQNGATSLKIALEK